MSLLKQYIMERSGRLALPIAVYPGAAITGATVKEMVTSADAQFAAAAALHQRYHSPIVLSAMDLSTEAETFGCEINMPEDEVPTVTGILISDMATAKALRVPTPGEGRTGIYLETARRLTGLPGQPLVLGGIIGPYSLAARLVGVSEAMMLSLTEPDLMHVLLEKCTRFLTAYLQAFKAAGTRGSVVAEPAAGLLSPKTMAEFSSAYIKRIVTAVEDGSFSILYHNCAAKTLHLPAIMESGASLLHFGAPMDMAAALAQTPADVILFGNLDPAAVFVQSSPEQVMAGAKKLLAATKAHKNFVLSSGCDVPHRAPLANLDSFYQAVV